MDQKAKFYLKEFDECSKNDGSFKEIS